MTAGHVGRKPTRRVLVLAGCGVLVVLVAAVIVARSVATGSGDDGGPPSNARVVEDAYVRFASERGVFIDSRETTLRLGRSACATALRVSEPYAAQQRAIGRLVAYDHLRFPVAKALVNAAYVSGLCTTRRKP